MTLKVKNWLFFTQFSYLPFEAEVSEKFLNGIYCTHYVARFWGTSLSNHLGFCPIFGYSFQVYIFLDSSINGLLFAILG
jgi:hypothetical protein